MLKTYLQALRFEFALQYSFPFYSECWLNGILYIDLFIDLFSHLVLYLGLGCKEMLSIKRTIHTLIYTWRHFIIFIQHK